MRISLVACIASLALVGWSSCAPSLETACQQDLPKLEEAISISLNRLETEKGRMPAAINDKVQREQWLEWAEAQLKRTQRLIDAAEVYPELARPRTHLGEVANEFVSFHGYAQDGRTAKMVEALKRSLEQERAARKMVCRQF